jgi:hypothetical protein
MFGPVVAGSLVVAVLCTLYLGVLLVLSAYAVHRAILVARCRQLRDRLRRLREVPPPLPVATRSGLVPRVTVQLAVGGEAWAAVRLLEQVARLQYPRSRLEIQILDDGTDQTGERLRPVIERLGAEGLDIAHLRRRARAAALAVAKGELVAMFDADCLPEPDFLRRLVPHFANPRVAVVQGRRGHLNRDESLLTRVEALMRDGHDLVENRVHAAAGWLFAFEGTGGIWRKEAVTEGGGWPPGAAADALDLSYRIQLAGWKFIYRQDVVVPGELPAGVLAFRARHLEWARRATHSRRELLARVLEADLRRDARLAALFHLHLPTHLAYVLALVLNLLLLPVTLATRHPATLPFLDLLALLGAAGTLAVFYALSQREQGRSALDGLRLIPALLMVGVGVTPLVAAAVLAPHRRALPWAETAMALLSLAAAVATVTCGHLLALPLALTFCAGHTYMAHALWRTTAPRPLPAVAAAAPHESVSPL